MSDTPPAPSLGATAAGFLTGLAASLVAIALLALPPAWLWRQGVFDPPHVRLARAVSGNDPAALRAARRPEAPLAALLDHLAAQAAHDGEGTSLLLRTRNREIPLHLPPATARNWSGVTVEHASRTLTLQPPGAATAPRTAPWQAHLPIAELF